MFQSLNGREIVLAGGAGGLGSPAALSLRAEGARVIVSSRSGREGSDVQADLTLPADRTRLLDLAPTLYGLVVYAGIPARSEDQLEQSLAVNFTGPILLAREAAGRMRTSGTPGAIVLISTMQATALFPNSTAYAAPKAALVHAARILAKECRGPANIRVNVICPGVNDAGMARASIAAGKYDRFLDDGVVPRWGKAEDTARAVRFLLEPDSYLTGQVLVIDGGLTL